MAVTRDITDKHLRRCVRALGYKGKHIPLGIADVIVHGRRPRESTLLIFDGETHRQAVDRLRAWAWGEAER